jgi:DNA-binding transcriptional LysR family regulator
MNPARLESIDLVISCAEKMLPGFEKGVLCTDTEVLVARKRHPRTKQLSRVAPFLAASHVAVVGHGLEEDTVDTWLRESGVERNVALRVPTYLQALQTVAHTDLVAVVPKRIAKSMARSLSLEIRKSPIDPGTYNEYVFYPKRTAHDAGCRWLRELTQAVRADIDA